MTKNRDIYIDIDLDKLTNETKNIHKHTRHYIYLFVITTILSSYFTTVLDKAKTDFLVFLALKLIIHNREKKAKKK